MKMSVEVVTPNKAASWLESNLESQRNVSPTHVGKLAEMMRSGEFDGLNGETIKFDTNDRLIDGQHRLRAIVESNCRVKTSVIRGCSSKAFKTIDNSQNNRTVENYYEIANQPHAKVAAQVAKWMFGTKEDKGRAIRGQLARVKTAGYIAEWTMNNHPDIPKSVDEISDHLNSFQKSGLGTKAHLAFCYYLMREKDAILAYEVVKYLAGGMDAPAPVFVHLRQMLIEAGIANAKAPVNGDMRFAIVVHSILIAWSSYRDGKPLRSVSGIRRATTNSMKETSIPKCL